MCFTEDGRYGARPLRRQTRGAATSYYHYGGQMSTRQLSDGSAGAKKGSPALLIATLRDWSQQFALPYPDFTQKPR